VNEAPGALLGKSNSIIITYSTFLMYHELIFCIFVMAFFGVFVKTWFLGIWEVTIFMKARFLTNNGVSCHIYNKAPFTLSTCKKVASFLGLASWLPSQKSLASFLGAS
jgi:hypothetical protein